MAKKRRKKKGSLLWRIIKKFFYIIWIIIKHISLAITWLAKKAYVSAKKVKIKTKEKRARPSKLAVIDQIKGDWKYFWGKLSESDSLIGIILGARGTGKTAVALNLLENLKGRKKHSYAMGFKKDNLPSWIKVVDSIEDMNNDAYVVIDEGGILFSSRSSMSNANKLLTELLLVARHKNLSIFFISQNSSNLDVNTLRQADFLLLKKSSLMQAEFERKIVSKLYNKYEEQFEKYGRMKGISLIYSDNFIGFVENDLPSFWSSKISKSFE